MKLRALIGPMSSAAGRQGIARLLAAAPRGYRGAIAAEQCEGWDDVLARLAAEPFDILIAEFGAAGPTVGRLLELQPRLAVLEVDLAGNSANVHVLDAGDTLVRVAEWLSREAGLIGADDSITRIAHPRSDPSVAASDPNDGSAAEPVAAPEQQRQPANSGDPA